MKKQFIKVVLSCAVVAGSITSCKKSSSSKDVSRATGWKINAKEGGFQHNSDFKEQVTAPGLVFIEGGTFTKGKVQDDVMHDWNNTPTQQHVQSFYMDETEVTNKMYLQFLDYLKSVYPPEDPKYANIYKGALPDTLVWRNRLGFNETMTNNYLRHPGYAEYPVVGVNWVQATQFAEWRTDRVNELMLEKEGYLNKEAKYKALNGEAAGTFSTEAYLNRPESVYGGQIDSLQGKAKKNDSVPSFAKRSSGVILPEYRLPTETEWEYAAQANQGSREYNNYRGRKKYPWEGDYTRNGQRVGRGDQLANFKQGKGDYGGIAGWSDDGADITNAVMSYKPNDLGLYDMAGNVSEWVADVYRPIVDDEISDFNYYRGNIYMKTAIGEDGKVNVLRDSVVYDTLPNGKIVAVNLPGEIKMVAVDEEETYLRTNFSSSDNRGYRDGEPGSTRFYDRFNEADGDEENKISMYNSPTNKIERDSAGNFVRNYDKSNYRTSLINDEVRVYKGGSWRDRAFWLDPAQRRYLPQYMATDDIGFRCAMSRVGSKSKTKNKTARGKKVK
ncbi:MULTISPECIES: gliding motility lipoprotein GldJ [Cellulophaga]|uniref:Gliding motility-associated lipoprotein GldJ n=2 Tax=Cellulophaga TaxID=104264 RepID=F0REB5_CELLC|nr:MULTISPECIES: gliding motility lipoprotein GldJ [Cellulophaga]ADY29890.1 gliding motility-associated lipoprotein GldJ [Cellulophaga lytica DSM 7489]AIM60889.1 gliding motility protein GldJ [Cellulophaga lytica]APU10758.1 gliding motility lipoprotein GldJ [Cellulophaga lytica]EWH15062.1 gliding motility-associated lipoprotein GldJ [Cellulophaga geojensis KL-A]MDO6853376.1 gliding motility lipoprotein GldJ [Cellulophaga lytica]